MAPVSEETAPELNVLVVDDDRHFLKFIETHLVRDRQLKIALENDSLAALKLTESAPPDIVITDWMMPHLDGLELTRRIREIASLEYVYIILLTAKTERKDVVAGLAAGADDYIVKPFHYEELMARIRAGGRVVRTQRELQRTNRELKAALSQIKTLKGLLPICMDCKKIRDDKDYWREIDEYIAQATDAEFSQGLCPECMKKRQALLRGEQTAPAGMEGS